MTFINKLSPISEYPGIGLSGLLPDPRLRAAASLAGLAASLWINVGSLPAHTGVVALIALAVAAAAWLALATIATRPLIPAVLAVMGMGGAVVAVTDANGAVFTGVAAAGAAVAFDVVGALALAAVGPAAFTVAALTQHQFPGNITAVCTAALAGLVAGASRREISQRATHRAELAHQAQRVEMARQEAELVAERNRLARELHDVLAHTLGALSIQLTAIDTLARKAEAPDALLAQIERGTELVGTGLREAREAVRALREDAAPLPVQLERLCAQRAELRITGQAREIVAPTVLALYRLAQEALTNAAKHAPAAPVTVHLAYGPGGVSLTVRNRAPLPGTPAPLHESGGGFGLAGMRERITQAGGECHAGPDEDGGWLVAATVPC